MSGASILYEATCSKIKSFQNLLLGNPAIFCEFFFKLSRATALCGIFLCNRGKFEKNNSAKTNNTKGSSRNRSVF